jgi:hypothetical protein
MLARNLVAVAVAASLACSSEKAPAPEAPPHLLAIQVLPAGAPLSVPLGASIRFTAIGTYSDGDERDVTAEVAWSSSSAAVSISSAAGGAGTASAAALGTSEITATDPATGIASAVTVQVVDAQVVSLAVSPDAPRMPVGTTLQLAAGATLTDATVVDLAASVTWASSDPSIATVSTSGLVTAEAVGFVTITARDPSSLEEATTVVEVAGAEVVSLAVSPLAPTILFGTSLQLAADATLTDETVIDIAASVTWTSSDPAIATVSASGLVTAVAVGTTTITANDPVSGEGASTSLEVTALPAALSYVALSRGSVVGGGPVEVVGTVALTSPATEPVVVALTSSNASAIVPESVVVPAGSDRETFSVTTLPVSRRTKVTLTASSEGVTKTATLNLRVAR